MSNENKKDFNAMLNNRKDMPKIVELDEEGSKKWGGRTMVIAPTIVYDEIMRIVPKGKVITTNEIRKYIARKYKTDITCPLTAGLFINMVAWANYQRDKDITPYWRTLKADGELNIKYPEAISLQKKKLEEEGFKIIQKGKKNIKYYVEDFENNIFKF